MGIFCVEIMFIRKWAFLSFVRAFVGAMTKAHNHNNLDKKQAWALKWTNYHVNMNFMSTLNFDVSLKVWGLMRMALFCGWIFGVGEKLNLRLGYESYRLHALWLTV